jgi:YD repeat-containing protein
MNGGRRTYTFPWFDGNPGFFGNLSNPHPRDGSRLQKGSPWKLEFASGRKIEFGGPPGGLYSWLQPSKFINSLGHGLLLNYDGNGRLTSLVDADAKVTLLDYATFFGQTRLWKIRTPDNRAAVFDYVLSPGENVLLASITDANGLVSSFTYPDSQSPNFKFAEGVPHTLTTPYGTTSFDYASGQEINPETQVWDDIVTVTDATGTKRAYGLMSFSALIPAFAANQLPVNPPDPDTGEAGQSTIDTSYRQYDNTFYWGPAAMQAILAGPNPNPINWGWAEMRRARITHWLVDPNWYDHVSDVPNHVQEPSPDGTSEGQVTFFDYPGKPATWYPGTSRWPSVTTRRLPNGQT